MYMRVRILISLSLVAIAGVCLASICNAQKPGEVVLRARTTQSPAGAPTVKVTADRNRVPFGDEVTFTLSPAAVVGDSRFAVTLFFGDGSKEEVHQAQVTHLYREPGDYVYAVAVRLRNRETITVQPS